MQTDYTRRGPRRIAVAVISLSSPVSRRFALRRVELLHALLVVRLGLLDGEHIQEKSFETSSQRGVPAMYAS